MAEAELSPILKTLSGSLGNFVFRRTKNGVVIADAPPPRTGPASAQQLVAQTIMATVSKAWKNASVGQRAAWGSYAAQYFPKDKDNSGAGPSGQAIFLKANFYRQAAGLAIQLAPPSAPPAAAPLAVTAAMVEEEETLKINVSHSVSPVSGYRLFVEVTDSLISPARNPVSSSHHAAAGLAAASFPALLASGQQYTISPLRTPLVDGLRFGIRATILTPDGIPGQPFTGTLLQQLV